MNQLRTIQSLDFKVNEMLKDCMSTISCSRKPRRTLSEDIEARLQ